jgi:hypothetical protein
MNSRDLNGPDLLAPGNPVNDIGNRFFLSFDRLKKLPLPLTQSYIFLKEIRHRTAQNIPFGISERFDRCLIHKNNTGLFIRHQHLIPQLVDHVPKEIPLASGSRQAGFLGN